MKCEICKREFEITKQKVYLAEEPSLVKYVLNGSITIKECIDCDFCGCQHVLNTRLPKINEEIQYELLSDITNEEEKE